MKTFLTKSEHEKKPILLNVISTASLKQLKYQIFSMKPSFLSIICDKCVRKDETIGILQILNLINNIAEC